MTAMLIVATILAIVTFATSLAHALEYPGKMRLDRETYKLVQPIYYPGFTIAGMAEPLAVLVCGAHLVLYREDAALDAYRTAALLLLVVTHAIYWVMTHPVNGFWLSEEKLGRIGTTFFDTAKGRQQRDDQDRFVSLRKRWEHSHLWRALTSGTAVILLLCALSA